MAGIGFSLRRLAQQDLLSANLRSFGHAAVAASGPWLFTIIALSGIELMAGKVVGREAWERFAIVVIYNFSFSMVAAGPIVMVVTRSLADAIFRKDVSGSIGMLFGALVLLYGVLAAVGIPFYGFVVDMSAGERVLSLICLFVIGAIWLVATFMTALKSYGTVSFAFAVGTGFAFLLASSLAGRFGAVGLLGGFTAGLAITLFVLCARIFVEYPYPVVRPFAFLRDFGRYWDLALVGLFYNAAIWVDKWIMWFAPGRVVIAGAMPAHPVYDGAMFMACLSIIPSTVLLLVAVETRFHEHFLRFFRAIEEHATIVQIRANLGALMRTAAGDFRQIALLQSVTCYLAILVAPGLIGLARGGIEMVPIFRFGALGALFHSLLLLLLAIAAYLDFRRLMLVLTATFFGLNASLTLLSVMLGAEYHGYGYLFATLTTLVIAFVTVSRSTARLSYLTFVANNASVVKRATAVRFTTPTAVA